MKSARNRAFKFSAVAVINIFVVVFLFSLAGAAPQAAEKHAPFNLTIYSYKVGTSTYVASVALADLINKNSSWLKASALESLGPTQNARMLAVKPELRKNSLVVSSSLIDMMCGKGLPPCTSAKYDGMRAVAAISYTAKGFITTNPAIKTIEDLKGRRVATTPKTSIAIHSMANDLLKAAGVWSSVAKEEVDFGRGAQLLKDGKVEAGLTSVTLVSLPDKYQPIPALNELLSTGNVYFVNFDKKAYQKAVETCGIPHIYSVIPAEGMAKTQTQPWTVFGEAMNWFADASVPEDVVHEVCRIVYEHGNKFKEYDQSLGVVGKNSIGKLGVEESKVHPGALKFFKEKKIAIGTF